MQPPPASPKRDRRRRLVTLGDLTLDIVVAPAGAIAAGSDVGGTILFRLGGSAGNTARSFSALGGAADLVGAIGDDRLGRRLVRALRADGVRPRLAVIAGSPTARLIVTLGPDGERSFVTSRGAADCLTPGHLRRAWFRRADAVHLPAYSLLNEPLASAARLAAEWAHEQGALVSVDLSSAQPLRAAGVDVARAAVTAVRPDIVFANVDEAAALGGRLDELARLVVIKLGADGCRVGDLCVPTERLDTTDTTGAGDAFDAGFLFALLGRPSATPEAAARAGHRAAAALLTVARPELDL